MSEFHICFWHLISIKRRILLTHNISFLFVCCLVFFFLFQLANVMKALKVSSLLSGFQDRRLHSRLDVIFVEIWKQLLGWCFISRL